MLRIPVWVHVERMTFGPICAARARPRLPATRAGRPPEPQAAPAKGTAPRGDVSRAAKRLARTPYHLLGYVAADGYATVGPVELRGFRRDRHRAGRGARRHPGRRA